jgi:hypothetical protein
MNPTSFEQHAAFQNLNLLKGILQTKDVKSKIDFDSHAFLSQGCTYIIDKLRSTVPILISENEINALSQEVSNCNVQINNFIGNNNSGHLTNAVNFLTAGISRIRNFPSPVHKGDFDYSKSLLNFHKILKDKLHLLNVENKELKAESSKLKKELIKTQSEIDRLSKCLNQKEVEIQNITNTLQTELKNFKSSTAQSLDIDRKNFKVEFEKDREKDKKIFEDELENLEKSTSKIVAELKNKLKDAKKLVNVIGNTGVTGNFQQIASYHQRSANKWRLIAIGFMTLLTVLMVYTIWDISINQFDWLRSISRIIAASILSYPATYAAQESSRHRRQENYNRKLELELSAINPFIELFDDIKKQEVKEKLVTKYFGTGNGYDHVEKEVEKSDPGIPLNAIERLFKLFGSIHK